MSKILLIILFSFNCYSQIEHINIYNPVYDFLTRLESKGYLENKSLSDLPLQKKQILEILKSINPIELSIAERVTLNKFIQEFEVNLSQTNTLISNDIYKNKLFSNNFINNEKLIYADYDSNYYVQIHPLGTIEYRNSKNTNVSFAEVGFRLNGTLGKNLGYNLQVTNGSQISGDRNLLLEDRRFNQNVKYNLLESDFDFTESHVRFDYEWFYAYIGRESRLLGSGINQRLFISDNAPAFDMFSLGARFKKFEYRFNYSSLLSIPNDSNSITGFLNQFEPKYLVTHRFSFRPKWGEISLFENIIYSGRNQDLAYFNPLSFLKSLEHALHDRDNTALGMDFVFRPLKNLQFKGSYFLDDIVFSEIGTGYWSNKTALNIGFITSLPYNIDFGGEYSRCEPYVFSHFNPLNSQTNDQIQFTGYLPPNSEEWKLIMKFWFGGRYPLKFDFSYFRHGKNVYENDSLVKNVGGDVLISNRGFDPWTVTFLDGILDQTLKLNINYRIEIIRGFNFGINYQFLNNNITNNTNSFFINLRYGDY